MYLFQTTRLVVVAQTLAIDPNGNTLVYSTYPASVRYEGVYRLGTIAKECRQLMEEEDEEEEEHLAPADSAIVGTLLMDPVPPT
ncbi:hypothetical protein Tco_0687393 [Tanacetum coccineum]